MYAAVIFVHQKIKKIIPLQWIYENNEKIVRKKHYLSYFNLDMEIGAPPYEVLKINSTNHLINNQTHKIYLYKILGKLSILI